MAASEGNTREEVRRLVAAGHSVDARTELGLTPLSYAAWQGHLETMEYLISAGADVHARQESGYTALGRVPGSDTDSTDRDRIAEALLAAGADVNCVGPGNQTPLFGAASNGYVSLVELLLKHVADPSIVATYENGVTPLDVARDEAVVKLLSTPSSKPIAQPAEGQGERAGQMRVALETIIAYFPLCQQR